MKPANAKRRARLRVLVTEAIRGFPGSGLLALPGVYDAEANSHGAVAIRVDGRLLGVKPGEFEALDICLSNELESSNDQDRRADTERSSA